jgi:hypothetical protein
MFIASFGTCFRNQQVAEQHAKNRAERRQRRFDVFEQFGSFYVVPGLSVASGDGGPKLVASFVENPAGLLLDVRY